MAHTDAELIRRILRGDQDAFSPLVKKYQKGVHTLAWRKIGDFHIAQEITQDAFLTAYKKLRTLKNHNQFAGWLYVIAANLCRDWLKKSRLPMESLDAEDANNTNEVDKVSYSRYVAEKQETEADETRREIVKELLQEITGKRTDGDNDALPWRDDDQSHFRVSRCLPEYRQESTQSRPQPFTERGRYNSREPW